MDQASPTIIDVIGLSARYSGTDVLRDVSFSAGENQITVLLGPSGCGKTTLLKHVIGLLPVRQGSVRVMDANLAEMNENEKNAMYLKIGVFYQNGALINSLTVGENIALPLQQHTNLYPEIIREMVYLKLSLVNLEGAYNKYPAELSGGMRKRAALARAISMDPQLLFLDEPGAGLDPVLLASLDDLILKLRDKLHISMLLVTHEVASIYRLADRIVFLDQGAVLFEGSLPEALSAGITVIDEFFNKDRIQQKAV